MANGTQAAGTGDEGIYLVDVDEWFGDRAADARAADKAIDEQLAAADHDDDDGDAA